MWKVINHMPSILNCSPSSKYFPWPKYWVICGCVGSPWPWEGIPPPMVILAGYTGWLLASLIEIIHWWNWLIGIALWFLVLAVNVKYWCLLVVVAMVVLSAETAFVDSSKQHNMAKTLIKFIIHDLIVNLNLAVVEKGWSSVISLIGLLSFSVVPFRMNSYLQ